MTSARRIFWAGILVASLTLLWAYGSAQIWIGAISAVLWGFFGWLGQHKQKWYWTIHLFLIGVVLLVVIGVFSGLKIYLLLPAMLGALASWDLGRFQQRMAGTSVSESIRKIEKRHLGLLGLALGVGGIFAGVVLIARVHTNFGIALILGVMLVISLGQVYRFLADQALPDE